MSNLNCLTRPTRLLRWLTVCSALLAPAGALAADEIKTELSGLHLCCGGCTAALEKALSEVSGVSDIVVQQDDAAATFVAADAAAAQAALKAVGKAGFGAAVKQQGKAVDFPVEKLAKDQTANHVTFEGLHLCCKGCVRSVLEAFAGAPEVAAVDCDLKKRTLTLTGEGISLPAVQKRLVEAGFYGTVAK